MHDSKIHRSMGQIHRSPIMQISSKVTGTPHDSEWVLTIEWGGTDKRKPVLKLLPACSATLVCRVRVVDTTYSDAHRTCTSNFIYERSACTLPFRKPVFIWKKRGNFKAINEHYVEIYVLKYLESKNNSSVFNFSDCCPKYGIEK